MGGGPYSIDDFDVTFVILFLGLRIGLLLFAAMEMFIYLQLEPQNWILGVSYRFK